MPVGVAPCIFLWCLRGFVPSKNGRFQPELGWQAGAKQTSPRVTLHMAPWPDPRPYSSASPQFSH